MSDISIRFTPLCGGSASQHVTSANSSSKPRPQGGSQGSERGHGVSGLACTLQKMHAISEMLRMVYRSTCSAASRRASGPTCSSSSASRGCRWPTWPRRSAAPAVASAPWTWTWATTSTQVQYDCRDQCAAVAVQCGGFYAVRLDTVCSRFSNLGQKRCAHHVQLLPHLQAWRAWRRTMTTNQRMRTSRAATLDANDLELVKRQSSSSKP